MKIELVYTVYGDFLIVRKLDCYRQVDNASTIDGSIQERKLTKLVLMVCLESN